MANAPKTALTRITDVTHAWESLRSDKAFSGLTLDQFKEAVKPSHDVRAEIIDLEGRMQAALVKRDEVDAASLVMVSRVVLAVKADTAEGENGQLYAAMGFVRKSNRGTGLTRKRTKEAATPTA